METAENQEAFLTLNTIESEEATPSITSNTIPSTTPSIVVLQPYGHLNGANATSFRVSLAQAIAHATAVVVDLLWVEEIDAQGVTILLAATRQAQSSGKLLSFLAMDASTRTALDTIWEQQTAELSIQTDQFTPRFEQFLDEYKKAQTAPIEASDITKTS